MEKANKQPQSDEESSEDEHNESWFGIKPGEGPRETQNLFVGDRILTESEKVK